MALWRYFRRRRARKQVIWGLEYIRSRYGQQDDHAGTFRWFD